jgi:hypothetical protein
MFPGAGTRRTLPSSLAEITLLSGRDFLELEKKFCAQFIHLEWFGEREEGIED